MEYFVGVALALATIAMARLVGMDRDRAFYPMLLMVVATYYVAFATSAGWRSLVPEAAIAVAYFAIAIAGFRRSPWIVVAGLLAHGSMDMFHSSLVMNPGVPAEWPGFCMAYDVAAGLLLAVLIRTGAKPIRA